MNRRALALALLAVAALFLYAFQNAADASSQYAPVYGTFALSRGELALRLNMVLLVLPAAALLAAAAGIGAAPRALAKWDALSAAHRGWALAIAAWVLVATWAIRAFVLLGTQVTDDENVYELQAQLLATGRFYVPSLPEPFRAFLDNQFVVNDGRRYGLYFLGHPAILAAARRVALAEWVGPLEAAATALLAMDVARRLFGTRVALVTGALLATSPFFLCVSATHLSQPTSTLFLTAFVWAIVRIQEAPNATRHWLLGAAAVSAGVITRPQTGAAFLVAGAAPIVWDVALGRLRPGVVPIAAGLAVGVAGIALLLTGNAARTGDPLVSGYQAYLAQGNAWLTPFGFHHSIHQAESSLGHLNFWLFGWPASLAFVPFGVRGREGVRLLAIPVATAIVYAAMAIPTVAPVGPVYYAECTPILSVLSAAGIERVVAWIRERASVQAVPAFVAVLPVAFALTGAMTYTPVHLASLQRSALVTRLPDVLAKEQQLDHAVVFVDRLPGTLLAPGTWAYFHRNADPDLREPVLFVRNLGPDADRAFVRFLGRSGYVLVQRDGRFALAPLGP